MDPLLQPGTAELSKGIIHTIMFAGHAMCFAYNVMAYMQRRETHLATNVVVHGLGVVWEFGQVLDHLH